MQEPDDDDEPPKPKESKDPFIAFPKGSVCIQFSNALLSHKGQFHKFRQAQTNQSKAIKRIGESTNTQVDNL